MDLYFLWYLQVQNKIFCFSCIAGTIPKAIAKWRKICGKILFRGIIEHLLGNYSKSMDIVVYVFKDNDW